MAYDPDEYKAFMNEWKEKRKEYEDEDNGHHFCMDGVISDDKWKDKDSSKIMFLLKESYGKFYKIRDNPCRGDMKFEENAPSAKKFWRKMRMWTYIIDGAKKGKIPSFAEAKTFQNELNDTIAYVNLKKRVENKTSSNYYDIRNYVWNDKDFLLEQIDLINPHIIVCSGTFSYCRDYLYCNDLEETAHEKLFRIGDRYFIDFWHLSARNSYETTCNKLRDIVKYIK